jgi:glycosyltransferase involved in cell wall biosynthesis
MGRVRILYLADVRFPLERAAGLQTFETCRALAGRDHEVTLFVRRDLAQPPRDPWAFYDAPRDDRLRIVSAPWTPAARRPAYLALAALRAMGRMPDVVVTRDLAIAHLLLSPALARVRAPVVYESHGYAPAVAVELARLHQEAAPRPSQLGRLMSRERRVWRRAHGYVTLTRVHQQELEDRFGTRLNAAVIPDGVRLDAHADAPADPPDGPPLAVYLGRLHPWTGVDVLVDALPGLPGLHARIVGGLPSEQEGRERIEARARDLGVADRVSVVSWMRPTEVGRELARARVLVLPDRRTHIADRYASPLKLFEYLAAGRPIVASDLHAAREVLRHEENALLVAPESPDALADAIRRLLDDAALSAHLARRARQDAAEYGWDTRALRLEGVLDRAAGVEG